MSKIFKPSLLAVSLLACYQANAVVYEIENLDESFNVDGTISGSRSGFGVSLNDNGAMVGGASGSFAPVLSDEDRDALTSTRVDTVLAAEAEVIDTTPNPKVKPEGINFVFTFDDNNQPSYLALLEDGDPGEQVGTTNDYIFDVNNSGLMVGTSSAPAFEVADPDQSDDNSDRDENFWAFDYRQRALFVDNGQVVAVAPPFTQYGGQSGMLAANDEGLVVGYASTALDIRSEELIDDRCLDDWKDIIPLQVCTGGFDFEGRSLFPANFVLEAYQWQISNGEVVSSKALGKLANTIDDDDKFSYNSIALDVNNAGIAVGRAIAFRDGEQKSSARFQVATVYRDGEVIDLMDHSNKDWLASVAQGINNNNLVVGQVTKNFSGFAREKFFVHDLDSGQTELVFPSEKGDGSESDLATVANDINDKNQVVGSIEIDALRANNNRRTHGFLYDHDANTFTDLNDLLTCRSKGFETNADGDLTKHVFTVSGGNGQQISYEADIAIVDANKINDDGSIMATALVRLPQVKTQWVDADGNVVDDTDSDRDHQVIVTDSDGNPVFELDSAGNAITEQLPRAIVLKPTTEALCEEQDKNSGDQKVERSGAPFGFGLIMTALAGLWWRRRR